MNKPQLSIADIQQLHQAGHLEEAKQGYLTFLKTNTNDVTALHWLGILCAEEGNLDEAEAYLEKATAISPDDSALKLHFANILKAKGQLDRAAEILLAVIQSHPHFAAAYNNLGALYFAQCKWSDAIYAYQSAIDIRSDYVDAYYNLGLALSKSGRKNEALNVYQALIDLSPEHAGGHFQLGCLFMQKEEYQRAIEHFLIIEHKHAFHFETEANLAVCYLKLGMLDESKKHDLKALEIMPDDIQVVFNLAVINMQQGYTQEAIKFYLRVLQINPDYYEAHNNLGFIFLTLRNGDAALLHFREALRIQPNNKSIRHTIDILTQNKSISASPPEYIQSLFDSYADHFDRHLITSLHYQAPELMHQMVKEIRKDRSQSWDILDLGCGTGLCGTLFKSMAKSLVGVDLSEKMLAMAARKKSYDELIQADILIYLANKKESYDLILAADVLVYFGDLNVVFHAILPALRPHGLFVFNAEISSDEDYRMTSSGRFVHSKKYLDQLILQNHFSILQYRVATTRTQNQQSVPGHLYLLQK